MSYYFILLAVFHCTIIEIDAVNCDISNHPYFLTIFNKDKVTGKMGSVECGATLLNYTWGLTTATCCLEMRKTFAFHYVGTRYYNDTFEQRALVEWIYTHPKFNPQDIAYDICVFSFYPPLKATSFAQPVTLASDTRMAEILNGDYTRGPGTGVLTIRAKEKHLVCLDSYVSEEWLVEPSKYYAHHNVDGLECDTYAGGPYVIDDVQVGIQSALIAECNSTSAVLIARIDGEIRNFLQNPYADVRVYYMVSRSRSLKQCRNYISLANIMVIALLIK